MLSECWHYLSTPCPWPLRRMGHLSELIALGARYRRQSKNWAPHLERTRATILSECIGGEHLCLMGTGLLLDVPLDQLITRYRQITLVDILHMPAIRRRYRHATNVHFLECDVSGVVEATWKTRQASVPRLPVLPSADVIVSCNMLSQLSLIPLAWINDDDDSFAPTIIRGHLELMKQSAPKRLLIAEIEQYSNDDCVDMMHGVELPPAFDSWKWVIAPAGEIASNLEISGKVVAIRF